MKNKDGGTLFSRKEEVRLTNEDKLLSLANNKDTGIKDIENFINNNTVDINCEDIINNTPLIYAIENNRIDIVELLIDKGADVNKISGENITPLRVAIYENKNIDIFNLLINKGADIKYINTKGQTYLMLACNSLNYKMMNIVYDINLFKVLLSKIDVNLKDNDSNTCIDYINDIKIKDYFLELKNLILCDELIMYFYHSTIDFNIDDIENITISIISKFF
jgi:ankyrin repeat protein